MMISFHGILKNIVYREGEQLAIGFWLLAAGIKRCRFATFSHSRPIIRPFGAPSSNEEG
jgi:hypothetical protein